MIGGCSKTFGILAVLSRKHHRIIILPSLVWFLMSVALPGLTFGAERGKSPVELSTAIIQVAKKNIPSVVHIEVTGQQEMATPSLPFNDDPLFRRFFGAPQSPRKFKRETKGLGTGMIIDSQGHILTNYHVVGGANKIDVLLSNGNTFQAKLIGTDPKTDLAVIRITAKEQFPSVAFGDSDKVEVGEWVVAIGHPRGLDQTVTQGIISAKHRRGITDPTGYQDFLQTDAAINPGNSGGPLLNLRGDVIGVNTIIVSGSGGFEGIGLAIPSNIAQHVAKLLISQGKVERGWLGISAQDMTPVMAKNLAIEFKKGALIGDVVKGSPAEKAGIRKNDIVIAFQGKDIADAAMLRNEISMSPIGKDVRMATLRAGKRQDIVVRIGDPKDAARVLSASVRERLGAEVRQLTQKEAEKYRMNVNDCVVITSVEQKGPLAKAGFEVGDVILEVNGQAVGSADNFVQLVALLRPNQRITLLALDHSTGNTGYVTVTVR
jgi:serine protease Do